MKVKEQYQLECFLASHKNIFGANEDTQREAMREWFFQNFEDPAQMTPYESAEGGYQWIWGGPFDAYEELEREFSGYVSDELIRELADDLGHESPEWAPSQSRIHYGDIYVDDIAQISGYHDNFVSSLENIERLLDTQIEEGTEPLFCRMVFASVITALETYLSDAFINLVMPNKELVQKFVETTPEFKSEKIPLSEVFSAYAGVEARVKNHLADIVWHNLRRVSPMYSDTLGIKFMEDIGDIYRAIHKRHDIVHRNGKTKSGVEVPIKKADIESLTKVIRVFVKDIEDKINAKWF